MEFKPSKLGTKTYWDEFYNREIQNFKNNPTDTGECWFDDSGAEDRMVDYITEEPTIDLQDDSWVLDLGTGNGHLLLSLREAGVNGNFVGIDYSKSSVEFAQQVAEASEVECVEFRHVDLLNGADLDTKFDLVLDKGTLDAIALSDDPDAKQKYAAKVRPLIKPGGHFMITSCNFTKQELIDAMQLPLIDEIAYAQFQFGGQTGSPVVTLVFGAEE